MTTTPTITFRSDITAHLIKHSMCDADVVRAARVSTVGSDSVKQPTDDETRGLIRYLTRSRHGSCFEHGQATWLIECPIFVAREMMRHRVSSFNEESARYKELQPVFYCPDEDRNLQQIGKAGHYEFVPGTPQQYALMRTSIHNASIAAYSEYQLMLQAGIAREVARSVLPVNIYTSFYVTMNPRALMNFLSLRVKEEDSFFPSYPQREIEMAARLMEEDFAHHMPITHAAFVEYGRVAP